MKQDYHKLKAAEIFGVPYDQVTDKQRKYAKTVSYLLTYGTIEPLASTLKRMREKANAKR